MPVCYDMASRSMYPYFYDHDDDEEEEMLLRLVLDWWKKNKRRRRWNVRPLNTTRETEGEFHTLVQEMRASDEEKHHEYFRMSASKFDDLLRRVEPLIRPKRTHRSPVYAAERLAVTLRYLASGNSQHSIAHSYRLGTRTVSAIIPQVCKALWKTLQPEFLAVPSQAQWKNIAEEFWRIWNFPHCVGAIDGKHVQIRCPPNAGSEFYNYKGTHSIVLLATCDAHYRFTMVDIGAYGRESDGGVFEESEFGSQIAACTLDLPSPASLPGTNTASPHVFVGDAAFPLHQNLMRPYSGHSLTAEQAVYNYRHSRARRVIENAFGIMASRWRILGRPIDCSPVVTDEIVKACVVLHNFLTQTDIASGTAPRYIPPDHTDSDSVDGQVQMGQWREAVAGDTGLMDAQPLSGRRATRAAMRARDNLKAYFQTTHGAVPWQDRVIRRGLLN